MAVREEPGLLAVFWDIENCCVPRGKSAMAVVHCIRDKFLCDNRKEAEFLCVCDVSKEPKHLVAELNDAQVCCHICTLKEPCELTQACLNHFSIG